MPSAHITLPASLGWIPLWAIGVAMIVGALAVALLAHALLVRAVQRGLARRSPFTRSLILRTRAPGRFALMVGALAWALGVAPLDPPPYASCSTSCWWASSCCSAGRC